jgi:2-keto-3-deoxy-L-fuconate dehydrogenase
VRLGGRIAVISGAAGGIGRVACKRFCEEGAAVIGVDLDEAGGETLVTELTGSGAEFRFRRVDVSRGADVDALAAEIKEREGRVDVLFNNAGIVLAKSLADTTEADWDRVLDVNLKSVFLMARALSPYMEAGSSMVNVGSIGGINASPELVAYGPAKAAVAHLSRVLAAGLGPRVRVNAICPGNVDTPMPRAFAEAAADPDAVLRELSSWSLLDRMGTPEEIVNLALWLASDEASFVSGSVITIDGGSTVG